MPDFAHTKALPSQVGADDLKSDPEMEIKPPEDATLDENDATPLPSMGEVGPVEKMDASVPFPHLDVGSPSDHDELFRDRRYNDPGMVDPQSRVIAGYQDPSRLADQLQTMAARDKALDQTPQLKAGDAVPMAIRQAYADAMVTGETIGPDEFSDLYHGAGHPPMEDMVGQLPSHADLTDHSLAILAHAELPLTAEFARQTKANLADAWAETGLTTHDIYTAAVNNPALADALTRAPAPPQPIPEPEKETFDVTMAEGAASQAISPVVQALGQRIGGQIKDIAGGIAGLPEAARKAAEEHQGQSLDERTKMSPGDLSKVIDIATQTGAALSIAGSIRGMFQTPAQIADAAAKAAAKEFVQGTVREQSGLARRTTDSISTALENFRDGINKAQPDYLDWLKTDPAARLGRPTPTAANLIGHIEGTGPKLNPDDPFAPVADAIATVYNGIRNTMQTNYEGQFRSYYNRYFRPLWENPKSLDTALGAGRPGTSTPMATLPTLSQGLMAGQMPKNVDPLDALLHTITGMRNFISEQNVLTLGRGSGYIMSKADPLLPDGWTALKGTGEMAHPGFASSYNNWVGKGFYEYPAAGKIYDKMLYGANMLTGLKLSMSGYHLFNIAQESAVAGLADGIGDIAHGDLADAMKQILPSITILPQPVKQYLSGRKLQEQYLGIEDHGPDIEKLVDLFSKAGGRATGGNQGLIGQDNNMAKGFDLWNPTKWPGNVSSMKNDIAQATRANPDSTNLVSGLLKGGRTAALVPTWIGQTMSGVVKPLFEDAIPKIKLAAFSDEMSSWLGRNPMATIDAQVTMARRLVDSMDDRFGELVQDNLFWPRWVKQSLNLATISVGWEFGTLRAFGGAGKDIIGGLAKGAAGDLGGMASGLLSPRARWLYSFPLTMATMSSAYQYIKTGSLPTQTDTPWHDLIVGRTGGEVKYGAATYPERIQVPGYQKDAEGWYNALAMAPDYTKYIPAVKDLAFNKLSPMWRIGYGVATGNDPFTGNIIHSHPGMEPWQDYANWLIHEMAPISATTEGLKGSKIGLPERLMGMRAAGENLTAPTSAVGYQKLLQQKAQTSAQGWETGHAKKVETPSIATDIAQGLGVAPSAESVLDFKQHRAKPTALGNGAGGQETSGPPNPEGIYPDTIPTAPKPAPAARTGSHHAYDKDGKRKY